jgi:hypothetical protein
VIEAGNWNPRVIANEELDLHARLRARGGHVLFEDAILVDHFTQLQGVTDKLAMLVNWRGRGGDRYGAPGMALRSCLASGAVRQLIALSPEPFFATPITILAIMLGLLGMPWSGLALLLALWGWITWRRGLPYIVPSYLLFPQLVVGVARYGRHS